MFLKGLQELGGYAKENFKAGIIWIGSEINFSFY
jgi:hypothetical protein